MPTKPETHPINRAYSGRFNNIYLFVTERCQLRCGHCYMGERLERGRAFTLDNGITMIRYWRRMGGRFLTLVGGEPSLHPRLPDLVEAAVVAGYEKVMIDTNALLPEKLIVIPKASIYYVRVSMDGASAETHDRVRGAGNFTKTLRGIARLRDAGFTLRLTATIFRFNQHEAMKLVCLAQKLGVAVVNFHSFTPEGLGASNAIWALSPQEWVQFCARLENEAGHIPVEVRYPPTWARPEDLPRYVAKGFQGCLGCTSIFPDGRCYVCSLLFDHAVNFGSMKEDGFALNSQGTSNEFELFVQASMQAADPSRMGCPAERLLGHKVAVYDGLISVCRLWRTSPT